MPQRPQLRPDGTQGPKSGSDSPYRWDGDRDYKPNGCIKLKPSGIRDLKSCRDTYPQAHQNLHLLTPWYTQEP
ncbi:hypothetical protein [Streptomyces aureoversilis]|uniref:Uncharacterized protein n=1 Tax=Streptomyces aureoversilis TaxID=67277 RepID=A0ABV9ZWJ7_9ACTN